MNQRHFARQLTQLLAVSTVFAAAATRADVKLPAIFADHMVLQRDQKVPVWGWADEGERVTVEFAGQKVETTAQGGKWSVALTPLKTSSTGAKFKVSGKNKVEFDDVLVGEVWFCSGQSNMEWNVASSKDKDKEIAAANNPRIRHFKVPHVTAVEPQTEVKTVGGWQATTPATVGNFTAVGYFFAREIEKAMDVPIGLIGCNWGGTRIEPWTPPVGFQSVPALKADFADKLATFPARTPAVILETQPVLDEKGKPTVDKNGRPVTKPVLDEKGKQKQRPFLDRDGKPVMNVSSGSPLSIYNGMVHPIIPYAIRGALWYQGESNNGEGMLYFEKKKALINGWRTLWKQGDFPFFFVQLAPYRYNNPERLPGIWEAQAATLSIPNTGMAVTTDVSTVGNIHPPDKQTVGHRLALWALAKTYNQSITSYASPLFDTLKVEGDKAHVSFKHAEGGLKSLNGQPLTWFTIAGEDKKFVEAKAEIAGNHVVVSAPGVSKPVAVRFGWHELAEPNLANAAGLPASPFRTDKWTDASMPGVAQPTAPVKK
ncbi:MAG: sialate O-acetylesterase [Proteobacteria bacterium]|nr:sialate O-acetylesterase [Verrucomicrobiota bacterium]NBU09526.1 sialate O-acetylesterase [Pseudomonadota bacterium]